MKISKAILADVPALHHLINSAYRGESSKKGWTTEEAILGGIRIDETALSAYFTQAHVHILKCTDAKGEIIGTVNLEVRNSELYLGLFAVAPQAQNLGIGKALLQAAAHLAVAHLCKVISITVISSRTELISWYERNGYVATGKTIAFEDIEGRFGEPKQMNIQLIGMEKKISH